MEKNPINFNAYSMSVNQLKDCADALRNMFEMLDRDASGEDLKGYAMQMRDHMRKTWRK